MPEQMDSQLRRSLFGSDKVSWHCMSPGFDFICEGSI